MSHLDTQFIAGTSISIDTSDPSAPIFNVVPTDSGNRILSGGAVWSGTGYTYNVSALTYLLNGYQYSSAPTSVTMATADPTNDRFDAIVVDDTGTVSVITGTPSANPIEPAIPDTVTLVQFVLVEAGTTQPTVTTETIYDENTEWTTSNVTFSGTPVGTTNFTSTVPSPFYGTVCINNNRDGRTADLFTRTSPLTTAPFTTLYLYVYFTSVIPNTKSLILNFQNGSGQNIGNAVNLFTYGAQRNVINTWQLVVIPKSVFGNIPTVQKMRMYLAGGTNGVLYNWNVDYINFTSGVAPVLSVPTVTVQENGTNIGTQSKVDFENTANASIPATVTNDNVNGRVKVTIGNSDFYFDPVTKTFHAGDTSATAYWDILPGSNTIQGGAGFWQWNGNATGTWLQSQDYGTFIATLLGDQANTTTLEILGNSKTFAFAGTHFNYPLVNYANNAAAITAGLNTGDLYYTNVAGDGIVKLVI